MDNGDIESGPDEEYQSGSLSKYTPVVAHDRAVVEMATVDPGSSSSAQDVPLR